MININGTLITTEIQLEEILATTSMTDFEKQCTRNDFNNISNDSITIVSSKIKIYNFISSTPISNKNEPPIRTDFVTGLDIKLHRKSILVKGECVREEFYQTASVNPTTGAVTYSNLIIKEENTFIRNTLGFPVIKTATISYALEDGTFHTITKVTTKVYSSLEQIDEGKTRRGNLVDGLQMPCIGLISIALTGTSNPTTAVILEGRRFLSDYKTEFESFVGASDKTILSCLTDTIHAKYIAVSNYSWIDTMTPYGITIRQFLINELTI